MLFSEKIGRSNKCCMACHWVLPPPTPPPPPKKKLESTSPEIFVPPSSHKISTVYFLKTYQWVILMHLIKFLVHTEPLLNILEQLFFILPLWNIFHFLPKSKILQPPSGKNSPPKTEPFLENQNVCLDSPQLIFF